MTTVPAMPAIARLTIAEVASRHGSTVAELVSRHRPRTSKWRNARFEAIAAVRALTRPDGLPRFSFPQIAAWFSYRDHTSAMHAVKAHRAAQEAA